MTDARKHILVALAVITWLFPVGLSPAQDRRQGPTGIATEQGDLPVEIGPGGQMQRETGYRTGVEDANLIHAHFLWESRYVSEGRDNLNGEPLASLASDVSIGDFTFAPWIARGYGSDYSELNLNAVYGTRLTDEIEVYAGYTHLQMREQGNPAHDNEVSAELVFTGLGVVDLQGMAYHSFAAHGAFYEMSVLRAHEINHQLALTAGSTLGLNDGYIADGHDGLNHLQFRGQLAFRPRARIEVIAYTGYSIAIDSTPRRYAGDLPLHDFFWGGVGVIYHLQ